MTVAVARSKLNIGLNGGRIKRWIDLLQTKLNAHVTARDHLKQQGFDVFLPLITKPLKNGKFLDVKAPLFRVSFMGINGSCTVEERQWDEVYPRP